VSECKGLLHQVRGYGKPILLRNSLLDRARIIAMDRVVKHLIDKRRQIGDREKPGAEKGGDDK
jgi:hypothetical protein